jgi:hypothetical protein
MSMSHKAFAFDWKAFKSDELYALIIHALESNEPSPLARYIENHYLHLKDPYEGEPLGQTWQEILMNSDIQVYGDFALTHFYNPAADQGVAEAWMEIHALLSKTDRGALLGFSLCSVTNVFDPGLMGSYFQTPEQVSNSLKVVNKLAIKAIEPFKELLEECIQSELGIYVTF